VLLQREKKSRRTLATLVGVTNPNLAYLFFEIRHFIKTHLGMKRRVGARISDLMLLPLSCNGDPNVMRIFILAYNHTWTIRFRPRVRPHDVTRF
jgi:hypothetical protein